MYIYIRGPIMRAIRLGHSLSDVSLLRALYSVRCHTWSAFRWLPRKVPKKKSERG